MKELHHLSATDMQMKFKSAVGHAIQSQEQTMRNTIVNLIHLKSRQKLKRFNTRFMSLDQLLCHSWSTMIFHIGKVEFILRTQIKLLVDIQLEESVGDTTPMVAFIGLYTTHGEQIGAKKELVKSKLEKLASTCGP